MTILPRYRQTMRMQDTEHQLHGCTPTERGKGSHQHGAYSVENKQTGFCLPVTCHTFGQFTLLERSFHLHCKCSVALPLHGFVLLSMKNLYFFNICATGLSCWMFLLLSLPLLSLIYSVHFTLHSPAPNSLLYPLIFFTCVTPFTSFLVSTRSHRNSGNPQMQMCTMHEAHLYFLHTFPILCLCPLKKTEKHWIRNCDSIFLQ